MQFIPGTHRLGIVPHEKREYYLEISAEVLEPRLSQAVALRGCCCVWTRADVSAEGAAVGAGAVPGWLPVIAPVPRS